MRPPIKALLLLALVGCGDTEPSTAPEYECPDPLGRFSCRLPTNDSVAGAIGVYEAFLRYPEYELGGILHPAYRFLPLPEDQGRFDWLQDGAWDRTTEVQIVDAIFESLPQGPPQERAALSFTIRSVDAVPGPPESWDIGVTAELSIPVKGSAALTANVELLLTVTGDPSTVGRFQMLQIQEIGPSSGPGDPGLDSWAGVLGRFYRQP